MKKIVIILIAIALIAMMGTAAADPSKVDIVPGDDSNTLYHPLGGATQSYPVVIDELVVSSAITSRYIEITNFGLTSVTLSNPSGFTLTVPAPTLPATFNTVGAVWTVPAGTSSQMFTLQVTASTASSVTITNNLGTSFGLTTPIGTTADFGSGSNSFDIPEFPTVALPIAAILGLAFFFQRRREEE